ncbi:MAG: FAD-dependent thymidylate synthase [Alphaproteobacteria bacterium]
MRLTPEQKAELERLISVTHTTKRSTVTALEEIIYQPIPVLDHGFVRVIDYMGDDSAIVQSARVSYGRGTKKVLEDKSLINYLMRHRHTTPFEMCEIKLHVKLPIFVARQWIRHRTASVNEYSARYSILDKEFYIPNMEDLAIQSTTNKQGKGENLSQEEAAKVLEILKTDAARSFDSYEELLNLDECGNKIDPERDGLSRELARINLPLSSYTQWYWKTDLHNYMHFLSLRADKHAQTEIRKYAGKMLNIMRRWTPITYDAFLQYRMGGVHLSKKGLTVVRTLLKGEKVSREDFGMSKGEWSELAQILKIDL